MWEGRNDGTNYFHGFVGVSTPPTHHRLMVINTHQVQGELELVSVSRRHETHTFTAIAIAMWQSLQSYRLFHSRLGLLLSGR